MPKNQLSIVFTAWVKNVYSLRMNQGIVSGITLVSYTASYTTNQRVRVQLPSFTQIATHVSAVLSTLKNAFLPLLIIHLYPVSTAPIIKKEKEIKERNS